MANLYARMVRRELAPLMQYVALDSQVGGLPGRGQVFCEETPPSRASPVRRLAVGLDEAGQ